MIWYVAESLRRRMACTCKVDDFWQYINQVIMDGSCSIYKDTHNLYPIVNSQKISLSWKYSYMDLWSARFQSLNMQVYISVYMLLTYGPYVSLQICHVFVVVRPSFARVVFAYGWVSMDIYLIVPSDAVLKTNGMVNKERDGQTGWNLCMLPFLSCFYWNIMSWC